MKIYNSLTDKLEEFKSINEREVNMYVCGPTVYSDIHIGNARPIIFFDVVARFLKSLDYKVKYVSNMTDVDDKIIQRAREMGIGEMELVAANINRFLQVLADLNINEYDEQPRVTEYMPKIIDFIAELIELEFAYEINGDVYFRVGKLNNYGMLSNRQLEDLEAGARIAINDLKEDPNDFTLWKKTDNGINWDSPFSKGRPGWHTECVVMIGSIFNNETIDIHGGGMDLKFPHHENEIAQSCACSTKLANYWMHNGFINVDNTKMSKSIGNVINAKDFVKEYGTNVFRLIMLQTNYRQPINLTESFIEQTKVINAKFERFYQNKHEEIEKSTEVENELIIQAKKIMGNDFSTTNLITFMLEQMKNNNTEVTELFKYVVIEILGLKFEVESKEIPVEIQELIEKRNDAKKNRNFVMADEIREEILNKGYVIKDTREGVECKKM